MRNAEQLTPLKSELLDIFLSMEVAEHEARKRNAALRYLRARRGIEIRNEAKRLEQDLADYDDIKQ
ncbi:PA3496 family putative envelope integrity protein [Halomonas sp. GXIMD04776]|uniref:PA3496 family putative envelope integrity protein n=1 Tax=Halomonas sp. GXIMD04776 TaxID=3415605 RepID=UPI003C902803